MKLMLGLGEKAEVMAISLWLALAMSLHPELKAS